MCLGWDNWCFGFSLFVGFRIFYNGFSILSEKTWSFCFNFGEECWVSFRSWRGRWVCNWSIDAFVEFWSLIRSGFLVFILILLICFLFFFCLGGKRVLLILCFFEEHEDDESSLWFLRDWLVFQLLGEFELRKIFLKLD